MIKPVIFNLLFCLALLLSFCERKCFAAKPEPQFDFANTEGEQMDLSTCTRNTDCNSKLQLILSIQDTVEANIEEMCSIRTGKKSLDRVIIKFDLEESKCKDLKIQQGNKVIALQNQLLLSTFSPYHEVFQDSIKSDGSTSFTTGSTPDYFNVFPQSKPILNANISNFGIWENKNTLEQFQEALKLVSKRVRCAQRIELFKVATNIDLGCKNISICTDKSCLVLPPFMMAIATVYRKEKYEIKLLAELYTRPICTGGSSLNPMCNGRVHLPNKFNLPNRLCIQHNVSSCTSNERRIIEAYQQAKREYEKIFDDDYTGCAHYSLEAATEYNLDYHYRSIDTSDAEIQKLDEHWKYMLSEEWISNCIHSFPKEINMNQGNTRLDKNTETSASTSSTASHSQTASFDEDAGLSMNDESEFITYKSPPSRFGGCRILISEICPQSVRPTTFIELSIECPPLPRQPKAAYLSNFYIVMIQSGDPANIIMFADLSGKALDTEKPADGQRIVRPKKVFTIGTGSATMQLSEEVVQLTSPVTIETGIPRAGAKAIGVALLHIAETGKKLRNVLASLKLVTVQRRLYLPKQVDYDTIKVLEDYMQDLVVYGDECDEEDCFIFTKFLPASVQNRRFIPLAEPVAEVAAESSGTTADFLEGTDGYPYKSLSLCSKKHHPMQINNFLVTDPTPNRRNACIKNLNSPYNLKGRILQSTAQKVVVNAHNFFSRANLDNNVCSGPPAETTSKALGITNVAVYRSLKNWKNNDVRTPGKTRNCDHLSIFASLDDFQIQIIQNTIQDFYARNQPPYLRSILKEVIRRFREDETYRGEEFKCGVNAFRKILHRLGFRYGKLNDRAVILQRMDLVAWRARYLAAIRANDQSDDPLPVIYTDETWVDPNARQLHGWHMVTDDPKVAKCYTYQKHKIGRGGRIIIIHAGTKDGFIPEAEEVYDVKQSKAAQDYHDNMDGNRYIAWFRRLVAALRTPHIIVIDNASIHGTTDAPNSNALKKTMFDWLTENIPDEERHILEKPYKDIRRAEMWGIIKIMKATNSYNIIDKIAAENNHTLLRLLPYHCHLNPIEFVWSDVKRLIRLANTDQNIHTLMEKAKEILRSYPKELWAKHVQHIKHLEEKAWQDDGYYDTFFETHGNKIIIPITDNDDESTDDEE